MVETKRVRGHGLEAQARLFPVMLALGMAVMPAHAADRSVAVFPFEMIDTSLEGSMMGENTNEQARLTKLAPAIRKDFEALGGYEAADTAPVEAKAADQNLLSCGGCAVTLAREIGADVAFVGTVQKVSNLILNINGYAFDVATGKEIARGSADIRSNTDVSWQRGIDYLWTNVMRKQFAGTGK